MLTTASPDNGLYIAIPYVYVVRSTIGYHSNS